MKGAKVEALRKPGADIFLFVSFYTLSLKVDCNVNISDNGDDFLFAALLIPDGTGSLPSISTLWSLLLMSVSRANCESRACLASLGSMSTSMACAEIDEGMKGKD